MKITFLGTNGWFDRVATGNTICTLIDAEEGYFILDAGFGIHKVRDLIAEKKPAYLFISHFHLDHICGLHTLPYLNLHQGMSIFFENKNHDAFKVFSNHPFVASLKELSFKVQVNEIETGKYEFPVPFACLNLKHADTCLGYRFTLEGKTITYCSDTAICENDKILAKNADILIHECGFLPGEQSDWGHTSPNDAARMAKEAGVKKLILTHFSASGYDTIDMRKTADKAAKDIFANTVCSHDDLIIEI